MGTAKMKKKMDWKVEKQGDKECGGKIREIAQFRVGGIETEQEKREEKTYTMYEMRWNLKSAL